GVGEGWGRAAGAEIPGLAGGRRLGRRLGGGGGGGFLLRRGVAIRGSRHDGERLRVAGGRAGRSPSGSGRLLARSTGDNTGLVPRRTRSRDPARRSRLPLCPVASFRVPGSAILDPPVEADDSARSQQVHLPTRDHNWGEHRVGLLDVLAHVWGGVSWMKSPLIGLLSVAWCAPGSSPLCGGLAVPAGEGPGVTAVIAPCTAHVTAPLTVPVVAPARASRAAVTACPMAAPAFLATACLPARAFVRVPLACFAPAPVARTFLASPCRTPLASGRFFAEGFFPLEGPPRALDALPREPPALSSFRST